MSGDLNGAVVFRRYTLTREGIQDACKTLSETQSITESHRQATISTGMWLSTAQQMVQEQVYKASLTTCTG